MSSDLTKLFKILGHDFATPELLQIALRHSSLSGNGPDGSNERYEFLGDRVFGLVIAEMLLKRFPAEDEGDIAKRHTALVRQEALARVAETISLGDFIEMSEGEEASGGRGNPSVLSDCCEAVIAALYIDGGLDVASDFIAKYWSQMAEETPEPPKDAKTTLQEWAQARGFGLPVYSEISRDGPAHKPIFVIEASVDGGKSAEASGTSKQKAEQEAAEKLLEELLNE
jgi:ribonuclease-3